MADNGVKLQRKIIHVDFDAFFAAIEIRDNPGLSGRPIAVGGAPEKRGVIATCSYEARRFGVRSAMAASQARRLCPDLLIIPPRFSAYRQASREAMALFYHYTDSVEPLSLDEAYLDVSAIPRCHNSATLIARELRASLWRKIGITASAGVAPNKFLAKIASDWHKPDGLFVITPAQVEDFVFTLPVERIPGVGRVTAARLHKRGIRTCGALRQYSQAELSLWFGRFGQTLWQRARGLDDRPVAANRRRRSLSLEHTYEQDLPDCDAVLGQVAGLLQQLQGRYQPLKQEYRIKGWFVKVRFADFSLTCLEESAKVQTLTLEPFQRLFARAWARGQQPVRLLGIGVRFQDDENQAASRQLSLFPR